MAVTYTSAADRAGRRIVSSPAVVDVVSLLAACTALVAVLALTLAYHGRMQRLAAPGARPAPPANLATVTDVAALEAALAPAFSAPADRRLAARQLAAFLAASRQARDPLSNVAAILRAEIPAATIDATPGLTEFAARLRAAREAAARRGAARPPRCPSSPPRNWRW